MTNEKQKKYQDPLFEETLDEVKSDIRLTLMLLSFSFLLICVAKFFLKTPISLVVFFLILTWFLFYISHDYFVRNKKNRQELALFHFKNAIIDILLLTVVIHYVGGVEWIGSIFYITILSWTSNVLLKKQSLILAFLAICFYTILALLEYYQILPHQEVFGLSFGNYRNFAYVFIQILALASAFFFIALSTGNFSEAFRKKQEKLVQIQEEIEEAKTVLEIKVRARTRELKELSESLEGQVKKRTKDIEEKMEELEKFQKLTVGRELKMIELKEEVKKIKQESKKSS